MTAALILHARRCGQQRLCYPIRVCISGGVQGARKHGLGYQLLGGELRKARGGRGLRRRGDADTCGPLAYRRSCGGRAGDCCVLGELEDVIPRWMFDVFDVLLFCDWGGDDRLWLILL